MPGVIAPLLRVALQATAARSLRHAAHDTAIRLLLTLAAAAAVAASAVCLTAAAIILLERQLDAAAAWAIVGAFWGAAGLIYFVAVRRRR
jgi:hypothetical protein